MGKQHSDQFSDNTNRESTEHKGIKAVMDRALQSYEKLPMLDIVFERLVRSLTSAMRNLTSETVEISASDMISLRFGTYLRGRTASPASIAVFKAIEWDNVGLVILDAECVFSFVDVLLGGKKYQDTSAPIGKDRSITYIEQALARQVVDLILSELGTAFEPISPVTFTFERMEQNPTFAAIARPGDAVIVLSIEILIMGRSGKVDIILPYNTIDPIKGLLQQVFMGDKYGTDATWEEALTGRIYNLDVPIEAVIANKSVTLFDVAQLRVGQTIVMDHKHDEDVTLRCKHVTLFKGQIGKVEDKVAININEIIIEE